MNPKSSPADKKKSRPAPDRSYEGTMDRALTLSEYRARTREELKKALLQREYPEDTVDEVISRLTELGYLDDAAYAKAFVESTLRKKQGKRSALYALRRRGVEDGDISSALDEVDEEDEFAAALARGEKAQRRYAEYPPRERAARISRALVSHGFSYETVSRVLRALEAETDEFDR